MASSAEETAPAGGREHKSLRERIARELKAPGAVPPRVGRFVIERELGSGGMGSVYAAVDEDLGRRVAVKLVSADPRSQRERRRLKREAQALAQLSHPNIVPVFEVGEEQEQTFIAMELVVGDSLRRWVQTEPRSWREVIDVFVQAGEGLSAAHHAGLVHRDFKPDNVLVGEDGRVRVVDFGLATDDTASEQSAGDPAQPALDKVPTTLTRTGELLGTPAYMSPEQLARKRVGPASDQFSFCVALYEAIASHRPFAGDSAAEVVTNVLQGDPRPLPEGEHPAALWPILDRGLRREPDDRHPSMRSLLDALGALLQPGRRPRRVRPGWLILAPIAAAATTWWMMRRPPEPSVAAAALVAPQIAIPGPVAPAFAGVAPQAAQEAGRLFDLAAAAAGAGDSLSAAHGLGAVAQAYIRAGGTGQSLAAVELLRAQEHLRAYAAKPDPNHLRVAHELLYRLHSGLYGYEGDDELRAQATTELANLSREHREALAQAGVDVGLPTRHNLQFFDQHGAGVTATLNHRERCIEPCTMAVVVDGDIHHLAFTREGFFTQVTIWWPSSPTSNGPSLRGMQAILPGQVDSVPELPVPIPLRGPVSVPPGPPG